ncbi:hypothetical protein D3C85_1708120 [compost metagenome]
MRPDLIDREEQVERYRYEIVDHYRIAGCVEHHPVLALIRIDPNRGDHKRLKHNNIDESENGGQYIIMEKLLKVADEISLYGMEPSGKI